MRDPSAISASFELDVCLRARNGTLRCAGDVPSSAPRPQCSALSLRIGRYTLTARSVLAPMAGVTDRPFRQLCRRFGAALAPAEMLSADQRLWNSAKSRRRMDHDGEPEPRVVQLVGSEPQELADAARVNVELGAQIIDINMGCPAKKVCRRDAGSALLADEALVERILSAVDAR